MKDTIVATATSLASPAGINIIRISGEKALEVAQQIFYNKEFFSEIIANKMYLGTVKTQLIKEKAFCVYYKAPKSYTGEDVIEIHCHGGKIVTEAIIREIVDKKVRPAQAGEFTKRAFLNNKLTLDMAEGIYGVINATSQSDLNNSYRIMDGELGKTLIAVENKLISCTATLEAILDYPEELEHESVAVKSSLFECMDFIEKMLLSSKYTKILREGVYIAIVGMPNSGKSSLLNALVQQDAAIVSEIAGTTRDILKESIEYQSIKINFLDTAGIRKSDNIIEEMGIERAKKAIKTADIVIFVQNAVEKEQSGEQQIIELFADKKVIYVVNKIDIAKSNKKGIKISAKTGENIDKIMEQIMHLIDIEAITNQAIITNERHIFALKQTKKHIKDSLDCMEHMPIECVLVDIRQGLEQINKITGRDVTESVISEIFDKFCVGK